MRAISAAAQTQAALVLLHNSLAYPQAQPRALCILGAEKRLEDARHVFPGNAAAIVGDGDANACAVVSAVDLAHANINVAAHGTGLNRIQDQIGKYLAQFAG